MACGNCAQLWTAPGALLFDTMGLFDDMKARMEKFSKDVDKAISGKPKTGPGHTLGGAAEAGEGFVFRSDRPLGMTLTKGDDLRAHVNSVVPGGQAEAKGVAAGWVVASLDGADLGYDGFMDAFTAAKASGRALKVGFRRVLPRAAATTSRRAPPLSTGERDARRDAAARAAEARDAKLKGKGRAPRKDHEAKLRPDEPSGPRSAEAQAAWERAKAGDERTKRDLGYDPFQAISTAGTLQSERAQVRQAEPTAFAGEGQRLDGRAAAADDAATVAGDADEAAAYDRGAVEAAAAVDAIVAFGTADKAAALACLETLGKVLGNAEAKPDPKFKKVRLGNKAIQAKILAVEGGLEALVAAGFALREDDAGETVLVLSDDFDRARLRAVADALQAATQALA